MWHPCSMCILIAHVLSHLLLSLQVHLHTGSKLWPVPTECERFGWKSTKTHLLGAAGQACKQRDIPSWCRWVNQENTFVFMQSTSTVSCSYWNCIILLHLDFVCRYWMLHPKSEWLNHPELCQVLKDEQPLEISMGSKPDSTVWLCISHIMIQQKWICVSYLARNKGVINGC